MWHLKEALENGWVTHLTITNVPNLLFQSSRINCTYQFNRKYKNIGQSWIRNHFETYADWCFAVWCIRWKERQTDSRETEMRSAGAAPCLYMHARWKNVSLNGSQLSAALRTAKTSQGNKIWHYYYYYYAAIINYPLSLTFTVFLTQTHTHTSVHPLIFPWSLTGQNETHEGTCMGESKKLHCRHTHTQTHTHRKIPSSTHTDTVSRLLTRYTMTGGYAPCRLAFADPSFMRLMERDVSFFLFPVRFGRMIN